MENENSYQSDSETETDTEQAETMQKIHALSQNILKKRDEAVEFRAASGRERIWQEDEQAFDTLEALGYRTDMVDFATGEAPVGRSNGPRRSMVDINIIRGKCETAEGRFADILLPVDDKNWGLKVTPVPELTEALEDDRQAAQDGNPLTGENNEPLKMSDVAKSDQDKAKKAMKGMETEIDDQLTECGYNAEQRKGIKSATRLGTMIMKGPNVVKAINKTYTKHIGEDGTETYKLDRKEDIKPASKQVDPWNVYPDPDVEEDITKAAYIFERDNILPRELRERLGVPGYIDSQIIEVLKEEPKRMYVSYDDKRNKHSIMHKTSTRENLYESWEYYGDLNREDLEALGVDVDEDPEITSFSACVVFVNEKPIKAFLNTLDTGDLPYDFFQWTIVYGSPWGIGIARQLIWIQRIIVAAWRAMMDNLGDSSGANIVIGPGISPVDGRWEIIGKKIWRLAQGDDVDVRKAFSQFQISNNQEQLQAVIELALRFADMETSLPMFFQSEKEKSPDTLGATEIMVDNSNVALRGRVKQYDDQITRPHLSKYYHHNMQYNKNPKIKGDFEVDPRGTSVLLERDQRGQEIMQVFAAKGDKDVELVTDWEKAIKQLYKSKKLDILKSDSDLKIAKDKQEQEEQPQDPQILVAQMKADTEMKAIKAKAESEAKIQQAKEAESERQRQHDVRIKAAELDIQMMKLSQEDKRSMDSIKKDLSIKSMELRTQISLLESGDGKASQVSTPPIEPPEKAPPGEAYTK